MPNKNEKVIIMKIVEWIMGASIPLPIACKAIALPFELITLPLTSRFVHYNIRDVSHQLNLYLHSNEFSPQILSSDPSILTFLYPAIPINSLLSTTFQTNLLLPCQQSINKITIDLLTQCPQCNHSTFYIKSLQNCEVTFFSTFPNNCFSSSLSPRFTMICTKCFLEGKLQCKEAITQQSPKPVILGCQNIEYIVGLFF